MLSGAPTFAGKCGLFFLPVSPVNHIAFPASGLTVMGVSALSSSGPKACVISPLTRQKENRQHCSFCGVTWPERENERILNTETEMMLCISADYRLVCSRVTERSMLGGFQEKTRARRFHPGGFWRSAVGRGCSGS